MHANRKMLPWFFRLISNFFLVAIAVTISSIEARISLKEIIVSGWSSSRATFVAMNEAPQKITASIISQYLRDLYFNLIMKRNFKVN
jgi:hypothetical protein